MRSSFLTGAGALAICLLVGCREAPTQAAADSQDHTLSFVLYSEAREARAQHEGSGARVSGITFDSSRGWIFTSSQAREIPPPAISASQATVMYSCETDGGPNQSGTTRCHLYSETKRERDAMIEDGHQVSEIEWNELAGRWEFDWEIMPI